MDICSTSLALTTFIKLLQLNTYNNLFLEDLIYNNLVGAAIALEPEAQPLYPDQAPRPERRKNAT
jgi:hypothetical protein